MISSIHVTHDSDDKQRCCAYQIWAGHFSVGQTLRTDQNMVLLFADTDLRQYKNITLLSLKMSFNGMENLNQHRTVSHVFICLG